MSHAGDPTGWQSTQSETTIERLQTVDDGPRGARGQQGRPRGRQRRGAGATGLRGRSEVVGVANKPVR
jgi:hypothetical protein